MRALNRFTAVLAMAIALSACGPFKQELYEDIGPNETGFYVPLEGDTREGSKFESLEVVEKMKVAAKRVFIPTREKKTGRLPGDFVWVATGRLIKVNRAAVTCNWTDEEGTGTSTRDEALDFGSKDGIAFKMNFTATAHIDEQNAAKFLYLWGQKELKDVLDTNVRSSLQTALVNRFGRFTLQECLADYTEITSLAVKEVTEEFLERGVTVDFMGPQGKPILKNEAVQKVIDERFITENSKLVAANQAAAQIEQNRQLVERQRGQAEMSVIDAKAAADVQIERARGEAASKQAIADAQAYEITKIALAEAEGNRLRSEALKGEGGMRLVTLKQIEQWKGTLPSFLINGSNSSGQIPFILNLPPEVLKQ